tara:strand:+ start:1098 stop:1217 length:120 start_codon:yes stop_codon:yes gene_type:complete
MTLPESRPCLIGVGIDVENDGDWTYGDQDFSTAYVELEE